MSLDVSRALLGLGNRKKTEYANARTKLFGFKLPNKDSSDWSVPYFAETTPLVPKIDDGYVFDDKELMMFVIGLERRDNMLFVGATGCGKTSMPEQFAARTNYNVVRINFDAAIARGDLVGSFTAKNGNVEFQYGVLAQAIVTPGTIIILDEYDSISPENAFVLQRLLQKDDRRLFLPETNELLEMHPDNVIVATANTNGQGDETGLYAGTRVQNAAQLNRFSLTFKKDYLPEPLERAMLEKRFPDIVQQDAGLVSLMLRVTNEVRKSFKEGEIGMPISTRDLINFFDFLRMFGGQGKRESTVEVLDYTILNRMMADDAETVKQIYDRAATNLATEDSKKKTKA